MQDTVQLRIEKLVFECRVAGNTNDVPVIFLHGFPETSFMWKNVMADISKLGFYCMAPNLRGYSEGACPKGRNKYTIDKLVSDVVSIARSTGREKFHLVGHDWGSAIGWQVVHDYPDAVYSWTALSVPHLQAFGEAMTCDKEQRRMSSYIRSFQLPILPERNILKNDLEVFRKLWRNSAPDEVADYLSVFRKKKLLTAALNYYRANYKLFRQAPDRQILGEIQVPTLFVWGKNDMAIGRYAVNNGHHYIKGKYTFLELDAGHWLIQTKFEEINSALIKHLTENNG